MKAFRLNRLFNAQSRRCFDVAVDHGFFNERGFLSGIENLGQCVRTLVAAAPDAIQLTIGQAELLQGIPGRDKPALVLRTDVANVYGSELPRALFSRMIGNAAEQAVRLDAACVVVNLFRIPGQPEVTDQCIKADPTDDVGEYHRVVEIAGRIPVLVRGGGKAPDAEILDRTEKLIAQGAAGIVYGRNIIQHADPAGMTRALMAIVHEGATAAEAARKIGPGK